MRYLLLLTLLALGLLAAWAAQRGDIHSSLFIEPGKQFVLGGDQPGAFQVRARNVGPVPVAVRERLPGGQVLERGTLPPGGRASLSFAPGATALVCNASARPAHLDLVISGSHPGRMTYEPAGAPPK